jgi:hypothetical protein
MANIARLAVRGLFEVERPEHDDVIELRALSSSFSEHVSIEASAWILAHVTGRCFRSVARSRIGRNESSTIGQEDV